MHEVKLNEIILFYKGDDATFWYKLLTSQTDHLSCSMSINTFLLSFIDLSNSFWVNTFPARQYIRYILYTY